MGRTPRNGLLTSPVWQAQAQSDELASHHLRISQVSTNSPYFDHDMFRTVPGGTGLNRSDIQRYALWSARAKVERGALGTAGEKLWLAGLLAQTADGPTHDAAELKALKAARDEDDSADRQRQNRKRVRPPGSAAKATIAERGSMRYTFHGGGPSDGALTGQ